MHPFYRVAFTLLRLRSLAVLVPLLLTLEDADAASSPVPEIILRDGLALRSGGRPGRTAFHTDAVEALIVGGRWTAPRAGDTVLMPNGTNRTWEAAEAREDGTFTNAAVRAGYIYLSYVAESNQVLLLKAAGHSMVYVNGEPRTGDPYQKCWRSRSGSWEQTRVRPI